MIFLWVSEWNLNRFSLINIWKQSFDDHFLKWGETGLSPFYTGGKRYVIFDGLNAIYCCQSIWCRAVLLYLTIRVVFKELYDVWFPISYVGIFLDYSIAVILQSVYHNTFFRKEVYIWQNFEYSAQICRMSFLVRKLLPGSLVVPLTISLSYTVFASFWLKTSIGQVIRFKLIDC